MQIVVMNLKSNVEIGMEVHNDHDQFIRVESGKCKAIVKNNNKYEEYIMTDGYGIIIPSGIYHNIINFSNDNLKLYTIYTPPEHKNNLIQKEKPTLLDKIDKYNKKLNLLENNFVTK